MRTTADEAVQVTMTQGTVFVLKFKPGASKLPLLDGLAALYDRYRLESLTISFQPSMSASTNGTNVIAVDLDPRTAPADMTSLLRFSPKVIAPVSQRRVLSVPRAQLMSRKLLYTYRSTENGRSAEDDTALQICVASDATASSGGALSLGYLTLRYTIYLEGPYAGN